MGDSINIERVPRRPRWVPSELAIAGFLVAALAGTLYIDPDLLAPMETKRHLFLTVLALPLLLAWSRLWQEWTALRRWQQVAVLLPFLIFLASGLLASRPMPALARAGFLAALVLSALVVSTLSPTRHVLLLGSILAAGTLVALVGVAERLGLVSGPSSASSAAQPVSLFGNVAFSSEVVLPAAWIAMWFVSRSNKSIWPLWSLVHVILVGYLAVAGTRAALVIYILVGGVTTLVEWRRSTANARCAVTFLLGSVVLAPNLFGDASATTPSTTEVDDTESQRPVDARTAAVRWHIYRSILTGVVPDHPVTGLGTGSFDELYPPYRDPEEIRISSPSGELTVVNTAHSDILEVLADSGALGLLAALLAMAILCAPLARARTDATSSWLIAAVAALALNAFVRSPLLDNTGSAASFWIVLGVLRGRGLAGGPRTEDTDTQSPLVARISLGALLAFGLLACFLGLRGVVADQTRLRATKLARVKPSSERIEPLLRRTLALEPGDYRTRFFLARTMRTRATGDATKLEATLGQVERGLERAPYSIEGLEMKAEYTQDLVAHAPELAEKEELLQSAIEALELAQELNPIVDRLRANTLYLQAARADLRGDLEGFEQAISDYLELRPDNVTMQRALEDVRDRLMGRGPGTPARQQKLLDRARVGFESGKFTLMKEALETYVDEAPESATAALEVARKLGSWATGVGPQDVQRFKFARNYAQLFSKKGHTAGFLAALRADDRARARQSWDRLASYADYREDPLAKLDEAVLLFAENNNAGAVNLLEQYLAGSFKAPDEERAKTFEHLLRGSILERSWEEVVARADAKDG